MLFLASRQFEVAFEHVLLFMGMALLCAALLSIMGALRLGHSGFAPHFFSGAKHAQGSSEYIVMLAVAMVVVMVTAALLGFFPSFSVDAQQSQFDLYWTQAKPIAITSSQQTANGRGVQMVLENKLPREIVVTNFVLTTSTGTSVTNTTDITLPPGGKIVHWVTSVASLSTCTSRSGKPNIYNVTITYTDGDYSGRIQKGVKQLAVICK